MHDSRTNPVEEVHRIIALEQPYCSDLLEFYRSRNSLELTPHDILSELCWVIYSSGFRYSVVRKYWGSITRAYFSFDVERVAHLAEDLESSAVEICRVSTFNNIRKAQWCIFNARRLVELDQQFADEGGICGFVLSLSNKSQCELVQQVPNLITTFQFRGIGHTTMFHLLKNLGIDLFKPDRHLRRLLSAWGLTSGFDASVPEICSIMEYLSATTGVRINELDTILFHYGQRVNAMGR